jgi:hypothetical protein
MLGHKGAGARLVLATPAISAAPRGGKPRTITVSHYQLEL